MTTLRALLDRALLDRALRGLAKVGADPNDDEDARLRKGLLVLIAVLILPMGLADTMTAP